MGKLGLQAQDLAIESFGTAPAARERGTVMGRECTCPTNCTCPARPTCDVTCNGTCADDLARAVTCCCTRDDPTRETCEGGSCVRCGPAEYTCTCL